MKYITDYKEFDEEAEMSLLDHISDTPNESKLDVLTYMKNGKDAGVLCSTVFDFVSNELVPKTINCYTDGEFEWDDREIYHFEKYNLELAPDFVEKAILEQKEV